MKTLPTTCDRKDTQMTEPSRYVFGIIAGVVALLVVVMLLIGGGGGHGPQRHGGAGAATPDSSVTASAGVGGHTPPIGIHTP
jgi:hypothetical protein